MTFDQNGSNLTVSTGPKRKGRNAPLPTYTFPTTGETVQIKRLGPFTMDDLRKSLLKERKPPQPPMLKVEIGDARVQETQPNPSDPGFIQAQFEYNEWLAKEVGERMTKLMVNYCIVCEVDPEIVDEKRAMLAMIDPALNDEYSDKEVYVRHYLMATPEDLQGVQNFILGQSMPTAEVVQEHIDTFPSDVPGEEPIQTPGAPIRLPL